VKEILIGTVMFFTLTAWAENNNEMMPGWTEDLVMVVAHGLSVGLVQSTERDYYNAAANAGNTNPRPFPREALKESSDALFSCTTRKASKNWSFKEYNTKAKKISIQLFTEAMKGGDCKPTGFLARMAQ